MHLSFKSVQDCLRAARELQEHYSRYVLDGERPCKSMDDLIWIFRSYMDCELEINVLLEPVPNSSVFGHYLKLQDKCVINVHPGLAPEMTRFVTVKELFHVVLDEEACRTIKIEQHLAEVFATFPVPDSTPGFNVVSEILAEIAAMEFMFPYARRREEVAVDNPDFRAIAEKYGIPQALVEQYMAQDFMDQLGAFEGNA